MSGPPVFRRSGPGENAVVRAARRRDPEAWAAMRDGVGEGRTEQRCLLTVEIRDVVLSTDVSMDVPLTTIAGPVQARGYDTHGAQYTCIARSVELIDRLRPAEAGVAAYLYFDKRRRLRISALPLPAGAVEGIVTTAGHRDVRRLREWLEIRSSP